jgi:hypothetical protein
MDNITLKSENVVAVFSKEHGMNLMHLEVANNELIAQSTQSLFEERFAGLGSLIGPHFYQRELGDIKEVPSEELFPHIARVKAEGRRDPFSHGIARYAPWKVDASKNSVRASLNSQELWNGTSLTDLEGFSFQMNLLATLLPKGISLDYSVEAEKKSIIGLHYYYTLPTSGGKIKAKVEKQYSENREWKPMPDSFLDEAGDLCFDAMQEVDLGFIPKKGEDGFFEVLFENEFYTLKVSFKADVEEISWQLFRPKDGEYICIEPLSARNPLKPTYKKSRLLVKIEIL